MPSDSPLVGLGSPRPAGEGGGGLVGLGAGGGGPVRPARWAWLRSQGLGLACGFGTVLLLAIGSVVMARTREGASAGIGLDDLTGFFTRPSPAHLWLYLLFPLAALYALNTTLATWDNVRRRWQAGQRAPSAYAIAVIHAAFLLGLAAHGVGGFWSEERGTALLVSDWQPLPAFGLARLAAFEAETLPGGMPREVRATVEWTGPDGRLRREVVGYNQPLSAGLGARLALLQDFGRVPVAHLVMGDARCAVTEGQRCSLGDEVVEVRGFSAGPDGAVAGVLVRKASATGTPMDRWLRPGQAVALRNGMQLEVERLAEEPAVALRVRETPGVPWALAAAVVLALGTVLMWRRLVPRREGGAR